MLVGNYLAWQSFKCSKNNFIFNMMGLGLLMQAVYFTTKMVPLLYRRQKEIKKRRSLGVHFNWFTPPSKAELDKIIDKKKVDDCVL